MNTTATRTLKRRLRRGTGLETLVDLVATVLLVLGALAAFGLLLTFSIPGVLSALSVAVATTIQWLLFKCLAEHLRLLKTIAGLPIEGRITGPGEEDVWVCSACLQMLHSESRCDSCGARIVEDLGESA